MKSDRDRQPSSRMLLTYRKRSGLSLDAGLVGASSPAEATGRAVAVGLLAA